MSDHIWRIALYRHSEVSHLSDISQLYITSCHTEQDSQASTESRVDYYYYVVPVAVYYVVEVEKRTDKCIHA
jgi:hypothetical protein